MKNCENLLSHRKVEIKDIPDIDLYMDQLTGYIETVFEKYKIYEDEKILTKTMINNYVKAKVIDKPVKRKYNKNQIMKLIMIYHLKNILSIGEIDKLFSQWKENESNKHYEIELDETNTNSTEEIYKMFLDVQEEVFNETKANFENTLNLNDNTSKDQIVNDILKLVLKADINKRLAELMMKEFLD